VDKIREAFLFLISELTDRAESLWHSRTCIHMQILLAFLGRQRTRDARFGQRDKFFNLQEINTRGNIMAGGDDAVNGVRMAV